MDLRIGSVAQSRAIAWMTDDTELLIGCDTGLYRTNCTTNQSELIFSGASVAALDILDPESGVSILGLRNGCLGLCDPRLRRTETQTRTQNQKYHSSCLSSISSHRSKKKQKFGQHPVPPPASPSLLCQLKAFPSSIDHLQVLRGGCKVLVKDITGNISSFDVRQLSKVLMTVARSEPARESKIDYSRFYIDNEESVLFTSGLRNSLSAPSSLLSLDVNGSARLFKQRDVSFRPPIPVDTVVNVWSLKSEVTKLRTIPLSLPQENQSKIDIVFASHCSSFHSMSSSGSSQFSGTRSRDGSVELDGSYFCCKTESSSIYSLHL